MSLKAEETLLEERKIKALERIALTVDSLTEWFEEIDKEEWNDRIQYYLSEFHKLVPTDEVEKDSKVSVGRKSKSAKKNT